MDHPEIGDVRVTNDVGAWQGIRLTRYEGRLTSLLSVVPRFERRPFEIQSSLSKRSAANPYYHAIVRLPTLTSDHEVPVGIVSRSYSLIEHTDILTAIAESLAIAGIWANELETTIELTTNGERMAVSIVLPADPRFCYYVDGDDSMRFRIECFNSVDRSTKLTVVMGWLRFVCANGLIIGTPVAYLRGAHTQQLNAHDVGRIVEAGLLHSDRERSVCIRWKGTTISMDAVERWVDGLLQKQWGVNAAARTYAICQTGYDLELVPSFEKVAPSRKAGTRAVRVPGSPAQASNAFDVAQILSWVAGGRTDLGARLERISQIPLLIKALIKSL